MSDLISMKQLITELEIEIGEIYNEEICYGLKRAIEIIKQRPTVEAKPVVHGEWEKTRLAGEYICSNCQSLICSGFTRMGYEQYKFCPECGADMRGGKND